ncbi:MAG: hypothetical protein SH856_11440 [Flavobacteriales bacterium]|nr:hypothetical protein [Flavobacteriales bacterium]
MNALSKTILGTIAGLISGMITILLVERLQMVLLPPPSKAIDHGNQVEAAEMLKNVPAGLWFILILAYMVGSFVGGATSTLVARPLRSAALCTGAVLSVMGMWNLLTLTHPAWFWITLIIYIPFALLGAGTVLRVDAKRQKTI